MADDTSLAGQDQTASPSWDVNQYETWPQLDGAVADLTHNGSAWADLSHNAAAERWYELSDKLAAAVDALGEVNAAFQTEYNNIKGNFVGAAADSFLDFASRIYNQSEEIYDSANGGGFAATVGNVGHDIQGFAQQWWDLVRAAHDAEASVAKSYQDAIDAATSVDQVNSLIAEAQDGYNNVEVALYDSLREQLRGLRSRFESRGGDLSTLTLGAAETAADSNPVDTRVRTPDGSTDSGETEKYRAGDVTEADKKPLTGTDGQPLDTKVRTPDDDLESGETEKYRAGDVTEAGLKPQTDADLDTLTRTPDTTDPYGLASDPYAASSDPYATGTTSDPAYDQQLQDAQDAANDALAGAGTVPSSGTTGSGGGTSGTGAGGGTSGGGTTGSGTGGGTGGATDPGAGGSTPSTGSSGSGGSGSSEEEERKKALDDARKAANDAIDSLCPPTDDGSSPTDDLTGGDTPATESTDPSSGTGSSEEEDRQKALDDARQAANDAIDGLADSSTGSSLEDYLNGTSGDSGTTPQNEAMDAVDKAIEGLPGYGGDDAYAQGLQDAKDAADSAIAGLPGFQSGVDSLGGGSSTLPDLSSGGPGGGGLPGGGGGGGGLPGVDVPGPAPLDGAVGPQGDGILDTDLASKAGLVPATGSGAVTAGAPLTAGLSGSPVMPSGADGSMGMPMGGMPMGGGMGGMGGGGMGQQKEREPATWLQAEDGTWQDHEDEEPPSVLGRK
ncbi:hypothetical protein [Actinophytocola oryzae]|uniref:Uncharacterized protein n=1 Tax=Actinophytocola oryzae TaxID=502181 RepID=A0A4R7UP28_9PSEU|nr:hypothetical protein [Actinophytocola oryzae]TDV34598.1 hypothetical protein CLV71_13813 [Actinophytocola oryzae]